MKAAPALIGVLALLGETIACSATYSNYRRFEISGRIVPQH